MHLHQYYTKLADFIRITALQASRFAKEVAGDFNPLHDPDAKRFCVPGDLLFSLILAKYGLSSRMSFTFSGMVGHGVNLRFPATDQARFQVAGDAGKVYVEVEREGDRITDSAQIAALTKAYVAFSGMNFPTILVPLMAEHNVMINADRPLVIYEGMSFDLFQFDFTTVTLELIDSKLEVNGRRGDAYLHFNLISSDGVVGTGIKKLVLSGLREYDEESIQAMTAYYFSRQSSYNPLSLACE